MNNCLAGDAIPQAISACLPADPLPFQRSGESALYCNIFGTLLGQERCTTACAGFCCFELPAFNREALLPKSTSWACREHHIDQHEGQCRPNADMLTFLLIASTEV